MSKSFVAALAAFLVLATSLASAQAQAAPAAAPATGTATFSNFRAITGSLGSTEVELTNHKSKSALCDPKSCVGFIAWQVTPKGVNSKMAGVSYKGVDRTEDGSVFRAWGEGRPQLHMSSSAPKALDSMSGKVVLVVFSAAKPAVHLFGYPTGWTADLKGCDRGPTGCTTDALSVLVTPPGK